MGAVRAGDGPGRGLQRPADRGARRLGEQPADRADLQDARDRLHALRLDAAPRRARRRRRRGELPRRRSTRRAPAIEQPIAETVAKQRSCGAKARRTPSRPSRQAGMTFNEVDREAFAARVEPLYEEYYAKYGEDVRAALPGGPGDRDDPARRFDNLEEILGSALLLAVCVVAMIRVCSRYAPPPGRQRRSRASSAARGRGRWSSPPTSSSG